MLLDGQEKLVIVGGAVPATAAATCLQDCKALGDTWIMSFVNGTVFWEKGPSLPSARYWHAAVVHNNSMYVAGGRNEALFSSDLYAPNSSDLSLAQQPFSFADGIWQLSGSRVRSLQWQRIDTQPRKLVPLSSSGFVLQGDLLYFFGGIVNLPNVGNLFTELFSSKGTWLFGVVQRVSRPHTCFAEVLHVLDNIVLNDTGCPQQTAGQYSGIMGQAVVVYSR